MGFDLRGTKRDFSLHAEAYRKFLGLAIKLGWEPAGTLEPDMEKLCDKKIPGYRKPCNEPQSPMDLEEFNTQYLINDYRIVLQEDALQIALALERLFDPSGYHLLLEEFLEFETDLFDDKMTGLRLRQDSLINFIKFCREGSFEIW